MAKAPLPHNKRNFYPPYPDHYLMQSQCLNALAQLGPQNQNWERRRQSRWWVEFLSREGVRHCFILASDKNKKDQKNLRSKLVDYCPNQDYHKQRTLKHRKNQTDRANHKTWPFVLVQINVCFLRGLLRWLTEQKNPEFLRRLQNAQRDTTNLAVTPIKMFASPRTCRCIYPVAHPGLRRDHNSG